MVKIEGLSSDETAEAFQKLGAGVVSLPDRKKHTALYFRRLVRLLRRNRYDILHVEGSSRTMTLELLAAWLAGVPVRIAHSRNTQCCHGLAHRLLKPFFYLLYTEAFACGNEAGRWLFGGRSFRVLYNGKDFRRFHYSDALREDARRRLGLADQAVFVHVGNFRECKNHPFLLEIYREIRAIRPDSLLYLMGEGERMEAMKDYAEKLGIADGVVFAGNVEDVPYRLQAADAALFPSFYEGLPNVVLEWQAMGIPCLISDRITGECALTDLVSFLPLEAGAAAWAGKAVSLLEQAKSRARNAERGTAALKEKGFELEENVRELAELYRAFAGRKTMQTDITGGT